MWGLHVRLMRDKVLSLKVKVKAQGNCASLSLETDAENWI